MVVCFFLLSLVLSCFGVARQNAFHCKTKKRKKQNNKQKTTHHKTEQFQHSPWSFVFLSRSSKSSDGSTDTIGDKNTNAPVRAMFRRGWSVMGGVTTYTYIYIYMCVCVCACIDNAQLEKLKSRGPWPQHLNFSLCSSHCPFADFVCATGKNQETKGLDLVFQKLGTWKNTHGLGPGCCQLALRLTELLLRKPRSP